MRSCPRSALTSGARRSNSLLRSLLTCRPKQRKVFYMKERRNHKVGAYLTAAEYAALSKIATSERLSMSGALGHMLSGRLPVLTAEQRAVLTALRDSCATTDHERLVLESILVLAAAP